jgi:hypothetical protein
VRPRNFGLTGCCSLLCGGLICLVARVFIDRGCDVAAMEGEHYEFFDIEIRIPKEGIDDLRTRPRVRTWAECHINGQSRLPAWLHLKGTSTFESIDGRPNFSLTPRDSGSRVRAAIFRDKFYLHNSKQDPSLLRDYLAKSLYRSMGVPAGKVAFASVRLNERQLGIYTVCEAVSKQFLEESFGSSDGHLFEGEFFDIPTDVLHDSPPYYRNAQSGGDARLESPPLSAFSTSNLVAFIAAEVLTANSDGFVSNLNNYWVYHAGLSNAEELRLIPHTSDAAFSGGSIARWQYSRANAVTQLIGCPERRERLISLIAERRSHSERLFAVVSNLQCRLLDDVLARNAESVWTYCKAFEALNTSISNHYHEVAIALQLNDGTRQFWHDPSDPRSWKRISPLTRISYGKKQVRLNCTGVDRGAGILLDTFARSGTYSFHCQGTIIASKLRAGLRLMINGAETSHSPITQTAFRIDQTFMVEEQKPGLFKMQKLAIQLLVDDCDGRMEFTELQIAPTGEPLKMALAQ